MRLRSAVLAVLLGLAIGACGDGDPAGSLPRVDVRFGPAAQPTLTIDAAVAATVDQRSHGLMGVKELPPNTGMLFIFREPVRVGFYMKNTLIPLDIAFIGRGVVLEVRSMVPCPTQKGCPLTYPNTTYEMALEVNAGTFSRAGIRPGTAVRVEGPLPTPE